MAPEIPAGWQSVLDEETGKAYYLKLQQFVEEERQKYTVFPPEEEVFSALELTPYEKTKVLLLGQDPYHNFNQAHGLAFSVRPGTPAPPSLQNIFKELHNDLGLPLPHNGYLVPWARQGVLLLNAVLTVRAHQANSHKAKGWEKFTDTIIQAISDKSDPVVFLLWGGYAQKKKSLINQLRHVIIESAHPSPLSAHRGFFGSRPFSRANEALLNNGKEPIEWKLDD